MKSRRYGAAFAILAALLLILLAMNLCIGSVNIPLSEILHILMKNSGSDTYTDIVMNIRFPRALAAAVLGGGLGLGGTTGFAMNQARDLGPRLAFQLLPIKNKADNDWQYGLLVPGIAPFVGAVLAALFSHYFLAI